MSARIRRYDILHVMNNEGLYYKASVIDPLLRECREALGALLDAYERDGDGTVNTMLGHQGEEALARLTTVLGNEPPK